VRGSVDLVDRGVETVVTWHSILKSVHEPPLKPNQLRSSLLRRVQGPLQGSRQANDAGDVFRPSSALALL